MWTSQAFVDTIHRPARSSVRIRRAACRDGVHHRLRFVFWSFACREFRLTQQRLIWTFIDSFDQCNSQHSGGWGWNRLRARRKHKDECVWERDRPSFPLLVCIVKQFCAGVRWGSYDEQQHEGKQPSKTKNKPKNESEPKHHEMSLPVYSYEGFGCLWLWRGVTRSLKRWEVSTQQFMSHRNKRHLLALREFPHNSTSSKC